MSRCVIVGAGEILDYAYIRSFLLPDDYFVLCDGGINHVDSLGITVDEYIGDFDSADKPVTDKPVTVLPREKDDTDTLAAAKRMLKQGFTDFAFIGVLGKRIDHALCNLSILLYLNTMNAKGIIISDFEIVSLVTSCARVYREECTYFSVICADGMINDISISSAKFPLNGAVIEPYYQYAVSNEVVGEYSEISVKNSIAYLIKSR